MAYSPFGAKPSYKHMFDYYQLGPLEEIAEKFELKYKKYLRGITPY